MRRKREPSDRKSARLKDLKGKWSDPAIFLKFISKKFSNEKLFSVIDFYNEWKIENSNAPPLSIIEENLNKLVNSQKIEKILNIEQSAKNISEQKCKKKKSKVQFGGDDDEWNNDDDDDDDIDNDNFLEMHNYDYTYRYKYIPIKSTVENTMSEAFNKIRSEIIKGPISILKLSDKLQIHHQKIRSIIDVLICLDIVTVTTKGGICTWNEEQERRIRGIKSVYPRIVELKKQEKNLQ